MLISLTSLELSVLVLLLLGTALLIFAGFNSSRILKHLKGHEHLSYWKLLFVLIIVFLFSYAALSALILMDKSRLIDALLGPLFLLGAAYVALTTFCGHLTIRMLRSRADQEKNHALDLMYSQSKKQQAIDTLKLKNEELEHFSKLVSHDLHEPLNTVLSLEQLMQFALESKDLKAAEKHLELIRKSATRMNLMIETLLDYSRAPESKKLDDVNLNEVLDDCLNNLQSSIEGAKASIEKKSLPQIKGFHGELLMLFQNLISNSIKFRSADRPIEITISSRKVGSLVEVSVNDNGIGIPADELASVFALFKRAKISSDTPGSGIGLAHCKKIVEHHGGRIWVTSSIGKGSTFKFTLLQDGPLTF